MKSLLALVAALGGVAGVVLAIQSSGGTGAAATARATLTPSAPLFGDLVTARVELAGAARGARVHATFAPFEVVRVRRSATATTFTIRCVAVACATHGRTEPVQLPPARVTLHGKTRLLQWPELTLGSRLTAADVARPGFRTDAPAPAPRYRVDPRLLGWALAGLAAALVLATGIWAAVRLRPRVRLRALPTASALTPLAEALALLERALDASVPERRLALDGAGRELAAAGLQAPAQRARGLAWSHAAPEPAEIRALLDECTAEQEAA